MATVKFTASLQRFFPGIREMSAKGKTLREILDEVEEGYPRLYSYLLDEQGCLREHVNIFIDGSIINNRDNLGDHVSKGSEIYIMQALSGG